MSAKVFLSYSHDSEAHAERVRALAERLRGDGIDCALDQYQPAPPEGWPLWMEQQVEAADFVLLVASLGYRRKASGKERPGAGHGVRFESVLLVQELYDAGMWNEKLIPVLLEGASDDDVPRPLRAYTRYRLTDEAGYEALYRHLTGQPLVPTPQLGKTRTLPPKVPAGTASAGDGASPPKTAPATKRITPWWRRHRLAIAGIAVGVVSALLSAAAWRWPRPATAESVLPVGTAIPAPAPPPIKPALYAVRVQVLGPDGRTVQGSTVRVSAGSEPQLLPDGWWEVEVPAAKVPLDGEITITVEHPDFGAARAALELGDDPNPRAEIRLTPPTSLLRGEVVDAAGRGLEGASVTVRNYPAGIVVTGDGGKFELEVAAAREKRLRVHAEHPDFPPEDTFCISGRGTCSVILERP